MATFSKGGKEVRRTLRARPHYIVRIAGVFLLFSCRLAAPPTPDPGSGVEDAFATAAPYEGFNTLLRLYAAGDGPIEPNGTVDFLLENISDTDIRFPPGYGTRIFVFSEPQGAWIELRNRANYIGAGDTLTPRSDPESNWVAQVTVAPDLSEMTPPVTIRVVVAGEVVEGGLGTGKIAAAFADALIQAE